MNRRYLLFFVILLASLSASAQEEMPGTRRVPIVHLMESRHSVGAASYFQRPEETTVDFTGTALMPKAHGSATVKAIHGGFELQVHLEGLVTASQIDPAYLTYVLWAMPTNGDKPQNLGELALQRQESKLTGFTNLTTFAMIVTAEPYFAVKQPSTLVVMQNIIRTPSDNPNIVRADLLPLRRDSKTPLDIYEARNAVRIARLAGAERYAAEMFHKALQLLQQAEGIFARKKDRNIPDVKEKAREATEAAEEARAVATEQVQQHNRSNSAEAQAH